MANDDISYTTVEQQIEKLKQQNLIIDNENMNIITKNVVFVSDTSRKYHNVPYCSGIKNVKEIPLEEAQELGYKPCKRCCK